MESTNTNAAIHEEIELVEKALRGETVNGVKIGDAGITREWLESHLEALKSIQSRANKADEPDEDLNAERIAWSNKYEYDAESQDEMYRDDAMGKT